MARESALDWARQGCPDCLDGYCETHGTGTDEPFDEEGFEREELEFARMGCPDCTSGYCEKHGTGTAKEAAGIPYETRPSWSETRARMSRARSTCAGGMAARCSTTSVQHAYPVGLLEQYADDPDNPSPGAIQQAIGFHDTLDHWHNEGGDIRRPRQGRREHKDREAIRGHQMQFNAAANPDYPFTTCPGCGKSG